MAYQVLDTEIGTLQTLALWIPQFYEVPSIITICKGEETTLEKTSNSLQSYT